MSKYLIETYYTCSFKVSHYLDGISENELKSLEKREDGKFEILDVKFDNRKTKNLDKSNNRTIMEEKPVNEFEQKLAEDKAKKESASKVQDASSQFDDLFNN